MLAEPRLAPPIHAVRSTNPGAFATLRNMRGNALEMWGRRAYEQPVVVGSFLGRMQVLLNDPEAIGHVLVRNAANYRRPAITRRLLAPLLGDGLLLSEGAAWPAGRMWSCCPRCNAPRWRLPAGRCSRWRWGRMAGLCARC
jgi:cytochrome P450